MDTATVAEKLAGHFGHWLDRWHGEGLAPVREAWLAAAHVPGTPLRAVLPDGAQLSGRFGGLSGDGALILGMDDGSQSVIHAGDIFAV
jgi:BirA family biotin operon repressor/biotin-[acetyl-CoA-carboxylase] ligase